MVKIVKNLNEANEKGLFNNSNKDFTGTIVDGIKEINKLIENIKGAKPQQQEQKQNLQDGDFFISNQEQLKQKPQNSLLEKKNEAQKMNLNEIDTKNKSTYAITINQEKIKEQLNLLLSKEPSSIIRNWTIKDLQENKLMVTNFLLPKLIEMCKYSVEIKEVTK